MKVIFDHELRKNGRVSEDDMDRYLYDSHNMCYYEEHYVYGIAMTKSKNIVLLLQNKILTLFDIGFFKIVDPLVSEGWQFIPALSHPNVSYKGANFCRFDYIGFPRIMTESTFFEEYINGNKEHMIYIDTIYQKMSSEKNSN